MLREELQMAIPAGGLAWPGARHLSAEKLLGEMQRQGGSHWNGSGEDDASGQGQQFPAGDVLDGDLEREWFPDTRAQDQQARGRELEEEAARAASMQALLDTMAGRGAQAGRQQDSVVALRGLYRPPWELALQRWLDAVTPSERSYARPSRRGADRTDVVLPGRKREGWTLHIVLDTSGSMVHAVPPALGAIADFCEVVGVDRVHLIQCDTEVGSDELLTPAEVGRWRVSGYGGSDLTPAMRRLADDPDVRAAIVLTDGDVEYPLEPVPYDVLWVLPAGHNPLEFTPRYGKVIGMTHT
jgi:predicted metal-dependent peptidase